MRKPVSSEARPRATHVLHSSFVPTTSATITDDSNNALTSPELGKSSLGMLIVAELSAQLANHLAPISEEVQANKRSLDKLQDSILQLSTQVEANRPACFESLPVLQHWDAAMDKLGSQLKASQANQQLSKENLDHLKEVDSLCSRGHVRVKEADTTVASPLKQALAPTANVAALGPPPPPATDAFGSDWRSTVDRDIADQHRRLPNQFSSSSGFSSELSTLQERHCSGRRVMNTPGPHLVKSCKTSRRANRNTMLAVFAEDLESTEAELPEEAPISRCCVHTARKLIDRLVDLEEPPRSGCLAKVVDSRGFQLFFGLVIFANIVILSVGANHQMKHVGDHPFELLDCLFLVCYCAEIAMKLAVHHWYFFVGSNWAWNVFDSILAAMSLYSTILPLLLFERSASAAFVQTLRCLKVVRMFRLIRWFRLFSNTDKILEVMVGTLFFLIGSFFTLVFLLFVFGLICVQALSARLPDLNDPRLLGEVRSIFGTVHLSMFTLFRSVCSGEDWNKYFQVIVQVSPLTAAVFVLFVAFVQIYFFNILTALIVVQVKKLGKPDQHTKEMKEILNQRKTVAQIRQLCQTMDRDGSQTISREEFYESLESDHTRIQFMLCGLNINNAEDFFELLLAMSNDNEVEIEKLVTACVMMKGGATAIEQNMLLLEARDFQNRVAENFLKLKYWQTQVIHKLDALATDCPTGGFLAA